MNPIMRSLPGSVQSLRERQPEDHPDERAAGGGEAAEGEGREGTP
jgi:hypothetical protein